MFLPHRENVAARANLCPAQYSTKLDAYAIFASGMLVASLGSSTDDGASNAAPVKVGEAYGHFNKNQFVRPRRFAAIKYNKQRA